ncbi:MAG: polysaccharide biosynthesis/export family protein [bacterium]
MNLALVRTALIGLVCAMGSAQRAIGQDMIDKPLLRAAAAHAEPGDRLVVHIVGEPLLSDTVTVNDHGEVPLPKIGVLNVSSFTISQLQDTLYARYGQFLRTPAIEFVLLRRISVVGEVIRPNVYFVDIAASTREVLARAGGFTENANRSSVAVVRHGERIEIPNWQNDDSRASDLRSGDQLTVGRKNWLALNLLQVVSTAVVVVSLVISLRR